MTNTRDDLLARAMEYVKHDHSCAREQYSSRPCDCGMRELVAEYDALPPATALSGEAVAWPDYLTAADFHFLEGLRVFVTTRQKIKDPEGTALFDELIERLRAGFQIGTAAPVPAPPSPGKGREEGGAG